MNDRRLWRVDHLAPESLIAPANLALGLRRHLAHADLVTVLMQVQTVQRAYVLLDGCSGCNADHCRAGCRVALLRRTLRAAGGAAVQLVPVTCGLARRPYARLVLAWPHRHTAPPDPELLRHWQDARLVLHWHRGSPRQPRITVTALLLVGADGPDPAAILRDAGWRVHTLPSALQALWKTLQRPLPPGRAWPHDPFLLLPHSATPAAAVDAPDTMAGPVVDADMARLLTGVCQAIRHGHRVFDNSGAARTEPGERDDAPLSSRPSRASPWPAGPGTRRNALSAADLQALVEQCLNDPSVAAGPEPGLTRRRIAALLPEHCKEHAQLLLVWFDRAGLLAVPRDPAQPWRYARCLTVTDQAFIAARLSATPLPVVDAQATPG